MKVIAQSIVFLLLAAGCGQSQKPSAGQAPARSAAETDQLIREQFIRANKAQTQKENDDMDFYARSHRMPFVTTGSGVRYWVYKPSAKGDSIREGMTITMNYRLTLLDGTEVSSSATEGPRTFEVGKENIESGIHKGVQYLKRGDKAILLIPSVLAHGLLGDFNKIPPQMPLVYDVEIH